MLFNRVGMTGYFSRAVLAASLAALTSVAFPGTLAAGSLGPVWAWVTARQAPTGTYTPVAKDQGNSSGGTNTVERLGTGQYKVSFGLISGSSCTSENHGCEGTVMVSALGASQRECLPLEMGTVPNVVVYVDCFDRLGNHADSGFSVNYLASRADVGRFAYLYAQDPDNSGYTPEGAYNYNSVSAVDNNVERQGPGLYWAYLYGPTHAGTLGNVQVAATFGTCKIEARDDTNTPQVYSRVVIRCRDFGAADVGETFWLTFTDQFGMAGPSGVDSAYVFANKPTTSSYQPAAAFRYSSAGQATTVTRTGVGRYVVTLNGMPVGGSAQVTAVGTDKVLCQLSSIRKKGSPQKVGVACYKPNGSLADSKFSLTFTR